MCFKTKKHARKRKVGCQEKYDAGLTVPAPQRRDACCTPRVANLCNNSTPTNYDDASRNRRLGTSYADMASQRYKHAPDKRP